MRRLGVAALVASTVAGAAWFTTRSAEGDGAEPVPFWHVLTTQRSESDPPENVDEAAQRADAVVLARVTGVEEGRVFKGWLEPPPHAPGDQPTVMVNVQLTVDRVVAGNVRSAEVLNLEMFPPPQPLTLKDLQRSLPEGQLLFFLKNQAESGRRGGFGHLVTPEQENVWYEVSVRSIVAEGRDGLYTPLDDVVHPGYLESFGGSLAKGADRAAAARR